ncbi:alpha/beta hydrolase [Variovorax sp. J22P271]|uniref:alpha/beta fold hydrolase n=1 Tax=Variovorax davisae TaxID=3053515 RepID=UPI002574D2F5|nr:alpha/beta hydrolase [Variovorax sp. J22P271]MDM0033444.1 alpha/beta hydrolase [Variovorax sp. J22P271]
MSYADSKGVKLYYEVHGEGRPIVFVHGGGGNTLSWFQQVPHFAKQYRVITVDLRGFKNSKCPVEDVHPRYFPDDMRAVLDAEGIDKAAFVCQSLGAWAGLPLAARHPDRVASLVLTGTPTPAYSEQNWKVLRESGERFMNRTGRGVATGFLAPHFIEQNPSMKFLYDQIRLLNQPFNARRMQDDDVKLHPQDFEGYRVPTLMMGGALDVFLTPDSHRHVATLIPGAELYEFLQSAHSAYFEEPEHFNRVVGEFLARCYRPFA